MIYALWELLLPLLLIFLLGYLLSWLIHRWRRRKVARTEWTALASRSEKAEMELASVQAAHDEVANERTMLTSRVASLNTDYESVQTELGAATRSSEVLATDLEASNTEIATLRAVLSATRRGTCERSRRPFDGARRPVGERTSRPVRCAIRGCELGEQDW